MAVKVLSRTTPNHKMQVRSWLAELVMLRSLGSLPAFFWRDRRWKGKHTSEVRAVSKFIKSSNESTLIKIAENRDVVTWTDYAFVQFLLQQELDKMRRFMLPKDRTPVEEIVTEFEDLREEKFGRKKKSLFEQIDNL